MREFPQPEDFPRPSLDPYIALTVLACVVLGIIFLRTNRKARAWDAYVWVVAGIMLSSLFLAGGREDHRVRASLETLTAVMWILMCVGCLIGWARLLHHQERLDHLILSLILVAAAFVIFPGIPPVARSGGGRFAQCQNNMHQLGLALYNYHDTLHAWPSQQTGDPPLSWRVSLLPYLDETPLYRQYDLTAAWDSDANRPFANRAIFAYECPSSDRPLDGQPVPTSYALIIGDHAAWTRDGLIDPDDIPDGASHTAILGEACGLGIIWTEPRDIDLATSPIGINIPGDVPGHSPGVLSSYHPLGAHVLMADGRVLPVALDTDPEILKTMLTADGGDADPF